MLTATEPRRAPARVRHPSHPAIAAASIGLLAAAVAATGSWIPSLWGDEAASLMSALRSVPSLGAMVLHVDAVHATYYLGLHAWVAIAGTSPFAVRLPSALAVGAAAAAVVLIGRRMGALRWGVVAGIVCAVLPRMTYVGEEARSYAFSAAIAAWTTLALLVALESGRRRSWLAYGALLGLGIWVFVYLALLAVAHAAVLLARRDGWSVLRAWGGAVGGAVLAASPLFVAAALQRDQIAYLWNRQEITVDSVLVATWFGQPGFAVLAWVLVGAGVIGAGAALGRIRVDPDAMAAVAVAAWAVIPSAILIGTSPLVAGFTARYLAFCAPGIALLMTLGIRLLARRRRAVLGVVTAAVVAVAAPAWAAQRGPYSKNNSDWAAVGARIHALAQPGDALVFDEEVRPSRRPRLGYRTYPHYYTGLVDPTLGVPYWLTTSWHDTPITVTEADRLGRFAGVGRVWAIEYATTTRSDRSGIGELMELGFSERRTFRTHRSVVIELTRPGVAP